MSNRSNLESDTKQMNDIVAALAQAEIDSVQSTFQRPGTPHIYNELQHLGRMLAFPGLSMGLGEPPGRAHSHGDVSSAGAGEGHGGQARARQGLHKDSLVFQSDIYLEKPPTSSGKNSEGSGQGDTRGGQGDIRREVISDTTFGRLVKTTLKKRDVVLLLFLQDNWFLFLVM